MSTEAVDEDHQVDETCEIPSALDELVGTGDGDEAKQRSSLLFPSPDEDAEEDNDQLGRAVIVESDFDLLLLEAFLDEQKELHPQLVDEDGQDHRSVELARVMNYEEPIAGILRRVPQDTAVPSALAAVPEEDLGGDLFYLPFDPKHENQSPKIGDVVLAELDRYGYCTEYEHLDGRMLPLEKKWPTPILCVYSNRWAELTVEGKVPPEFGLTVDLLDKCGIVGAEVGTHSRITSETTKLRVLGRVAKTVVDEEGNETIVPVNTTDYSPDFEVVSSEVQERKGRSKVVLVVGDSISVGKATTATSICRRLTLDAHKVTAARATGTASTADRKSLGDLGGATIVKAATLLGYPSTYGLPAETVLNIFMALDHECGRDPDGYWVVELADSLIQPETFELLRAPYVRERIDKLVLCAPDVTSAMGSIEILRNIGLAPDVIAGAVGHSPLYRNYLIDELKMRVVDDTDPEDEIYSDFIDELTKPVSSIEEDSATKVLERANTKLSLGLCTAKAPLNSSDLVQTALSSGSGDEILNSMGCLLPRSIAAPLDQYIQVGKDAVLVFEGLFEPDLEVGRDQFAAPLDAVVVHLAVARRTGQLRPCEPDGLYYEQARDDREAPEGGIRLMSSTRVPVDVAIERKTAAGGNDSINVTLMPGSSLLVDNRWSSHEVTFVTPAIDAGVIQSWIET